MAGSPVLFQAVAFGPTAEKAYLLALFAPHTPTCGGAWAKHKDSTLLALFAPTCVHRGIRLFSVHCYTGIYPQHDSVLQNHREQSLSSYLCLVQSFQANYEERATIKLNNPFNLQQTDVHKRTRDQPFICLQVRAKHRTTKQQRQTIPSRKTPNSSEYTQTDKWRYYCCTTTRST